MMFAFRRFPMFAFVLLLAVQGAWADEADDRAERFVKKPGGRVVRAPNMPIWRVDLEDTAITDAGLKYLLTYQLRCSSSVGGITAARALEMTHR